MLVLPSTVSFLRRPMKITLFTWSITLMSIFRHFITVGGFAHVSPSQTEVLWSSSSTHKHEFGSSRSVMNSRTSSQYACAIYPSFTQNTSSKWFCCGSHSTTGHSITRLVVSMTFTYDANSCSWCSHRIRCYIKI